MSDAVTQLPFDQQAAVKWWVDLHMEAKRALGHRITIDNYDLGHRNFCNSVAEQILEGDTAILEIYNDPVRRAESERDVPSQVAKDLERERITRGYKEPEEHGRAVLDAYAARLAGQNQRG